MKMISEIEERIKVNKRKIKNIIYSNMKDILSGEIIAYKECLTIAKQEQERVDKMIDKLNEFVCSNCPLANCLYEECIYNQIISQYKEGK